jgi:NitT/TauT family transport system substrate-binding protein
MNLQNVTVVNIDPSEFVDAIASGKVDAVVCAQPFAGEITEKLDNEVVEWSVQSSQPAYGVFVARNDWIAANSDLVVRFLKSINMAEQYTTTNPAGAKDIVQKQLNLSDPYLSSEWSENQFSLSLDQSLVLSMEDEARWMIANNMTNATTIPDFGKYIYTNGLENVSPDSVNIIQ